MQRNTVNMISTICFTILLGLTGCGGGGGGVSSDEISVVYKGVTTQATVDQSNASALSVDAMENAQGSSDLSGVLGKTVPGQRNSVSALELAKVVETLIQQSVAGKVAGKSVASLGSRNIDGASGSARVSVSSINPLKNSVSGSVEFNSYKNDDDSPVVNGTVSFDGTVDTSGSIKHVDMTLISVTAVSETESITLFGTISIYDDSEKIIINLVETNNVTRTTRWMKDFIFTLSGTSMTVSGTYYDHTHGWVTVSTVTPLTVSDYGDTPMSGRLLFTGSNSTNARLTYSINYSDGYMLEVNSASSGSYTIIHQ